MKSLRVVPIAAVARSIKLRATLGMRRFSVGPEVGLVCMRQVGRFPLHHVGQMMPANSRR